MGGVHTNSFPFLDAEELEVLDFQIGEDRYELLVKGPDFHDILEVGVVQHSNLHLAHLAEFIGGGVDIPSITLAMALIRRVALVTFSPGKLVKLKSWSHFSRLQWDSSFLITM